MLLFLQSFIVVKFHFHGSNILVFHVYNESRDLSCLADTVAQPFFSYSRFGHFINGVSLKLTDQKLSCYDMLNNFNPFPTYTWFIELQFQILHRETVPPKRDQCLSQEIGGAGAAGEVPVTMK